MKTVRISYTILDSVEVDDDATPNEIYNYIENNAMELGIYDFMSGVEWFIDGE